MQSLTRARQDIYNVFLRLHNNVVIVVVGIDF